MTEAVTKRESETPSSQALSLSLTEEEALSLLEMCIMARMEYSTPQQRLLHRLNALCRQFLGSTGQRQGETCQAEGRVTDSASFGMI